MIFVGKLFGVSKDFETNKYLITFLMDEGNLSFLDDIKDKTLKITASIFKKKRSKNANALLWECIGKIAKAKRLDKWVVYLDILKHYGKYTYGVFQSHRLVSGQPQNPSRQCNCYRTAPRGWRSQSSCHWQSASDTLHPPCHIPSGLSVWPPSP